MDASDALIIGGAGIAAYLLYKAASTAADVLTPASGAAAAPGWIANLVTGATGGASAAVTEPQTFNCGDAAMANSIPFGIGSADWPDSYLIPCAGGATVGMLRAAGATPAEVMNFVAAAECSCAAAQVNNIPISNNLIQTPAMRGINGVPYGLRHGYYATPGPASPGQFPRGHF